MRSKQMPVAAILSLAVLSATPALAQTAYFSTQGDFNATSATQDFYFDLTRAVTPADTFRFETFSSRGTTLNAAGNTSPTSPSSFDSLLTLFNPGGSSVGSNDDGAAGANLDSLLSWPGIADAAGSFGAGPLFAGNDYRLRLNEFDNETGPWGVDLVGPANALVFRDFDPFSGAASPSSVRSIKFGTNGVAGVASAESHAIFRPTVLSSADYRLTGDLVVANTGNASFIMDDINGDRFTVGGFTTVKLGGDLTLSGDSVFNAFRDLTIDGGRAALSGTARINLGDVSGLSDLYINNGGRVEVNAGTTISGVDAGIRLGDVGNATENQLVVTNGTVVSQSGIIGFQSGTNNRATLTGASATWTMTNDLYVGRIGNGTLEISNGAKVSNRDGLAGYAVGGVGNVTLTGSGSTWTNTRDLYLGDSSNSGVGHLTVNAGGRINVGDTAASNTIGGFSFIEDAGPGANDGGTLSVYAGSTLTNTANSGLSIGRGAGRRGTVVVSGAGSTVTDNETYLGYSGTGTLTVNAGGKYIANNAFFATSGGTATVTVDGAGSLLWSKGDLNLGSSTNGGRGDIDLTNGGDLRVGDRDNDASTFDVYVSDADPIGTAGGVLTIANGSTLDSAQAASIGTFSGQSGRVVVNGTNSRWTAGDAIALAFSAGSQGELQVQSGGLVRAPSIFAGGEGSGTASVSAGGRVETTFQVVVGNLANSNGTATVTGTNSTIAVGSTLEVGRNGTGTLNIQSAGKVTAGSAIVGNGATGVGTINLTDAGSLLDVEGDLTVGNLGVGTVNLTGGAVQVGDAATFGSFALVVNDNDTAGDSGGNLRVANGSTLANTTGLPVLVGSTADYGKVTVTGTNSTWTNNHRLFAASGANAKAVLDINAGGQVTFDQFASLGILGGQATMTVDGSGSQFWTKTNLTLGDSGSFGGSANLTTTSNGAIAVGDSGNPFGLGFLIVSDSDPAAANAGGKLTIANGSVLNHNGGQDVILAFDPNTQGSVLVTGTGSAFVAGTRFLLGNNGTGSTDVRIENGGRITTSGFFGNPNDASGVSTTVITGSASRVEAGRMQIAALGNHQFTVSDGGRASSTVEFVLGSGQSGIATATVTGTNSTIAVGSLLEVGRAGTATLNINAAGKVTAANAVVGNFATGVGTINLIDIGSLLDVEGDLTVGTSGSPGGRGTINHDLGTLIYVGDAAGAVPNTRIVVSDSNLAGNAGGNLVFNNGSTLTTNANATLAGPVNTFGRLAVNGNSSSFSTNSSIVVGDHGTGVLDITTGGRVTLNTPTFPLTLGFNTPGRGTVTVDGSGSLLDVNNSVFLGNVTGNNGTALSFLTVRNGGRLLVGDKAFGPSMLNGGPEGAPLVQVDISDEELDGSEGGLIDIRPGSLLSASADVGIASEFSSYGRVNVNGVSGTTPARMTVGTDLIVARGFTTGGTPLQSVGILNITGGGRVEVGQNLFIASDSNANGTVTVSGTGSLLDVTNDLRVGPGGGTSNVQGRLNINSGGTVAAGDLIINNLAATKIDMGLGGTMLLDSGVPNTLDEIRNYILSGYNAGTWTGPGIMSTAAQTDTRLGVGYIDDTGITIKLTLKGDADLSGGVNFDDLLVLAQNYNLTNKFWQNGDFNYDSNVNFDDLLALAQNYNLALSLSEIRSLNDMAGNSVAADWALARSMVPEPGTVVALLLASPLVRRRRAVKSIS